MGDRADINASYGGRHDGADGEAIMAAYGGGGVGTPTPTPSPTLATLTLSGTLTNGSSSSGTIISATALSTIVSNVTGLSVNSGARTYTWDGTGAAGTTSNGLVETLLGATGSPKNSSITVAASASITNIVIEGDSNTSGTPGVDNGSHGYQLAALLTGKTVNVRAQGSRVVGAIGNLNDGSNAIIGHVAEDLAYGPQLILSGTILTNDMGSGTWATSKTQLAALYAQYHAVGVKFAWAPVFPYNSTGTPNPGYTNFTTQRALMLPECRDPAVWSLFADYMIPAGLNPAYVDDAANQFGDSVHLSTLGQTTYLSLERPAVETIIDATRATSTSMYSSAWPASETNLSPSTTIKRYIKVSGIAHAGTALGASVSSSIGATIKLLTNPGGSAGTTVGTGSGNGYRIYPGDYLELSIPLSALNNTAVNIDVTVGSETRTISYTTVAAVTPVAYVHGDVAANATAATTESFVSLNFAAIGVGVLIIHSSTSVPISVTVGGVAATKRAEQTASAASSIWTVPIAATGARTVAIDYGGGGYNARTAMSWGVITGADATPTAFDAVATGYNSQPFLTGTFTVPASGLAVAFFGEAQGATYTPATTNSGTTFVDEGSVLFQSEITGVLVATKGAGTGVAASFNFAFGNHALGYIVFKAAGT